MLHRYDGRKKKHARSAAYFSNTDLIFLLLDSADISSFFENYPEQRCTFFDLLY